MNHKGKTDLTDQLPKMENKFGTWNVQGNSFKIEKINSLNMENIVLTDTKKIRVVKETLNNHIHTFSGALKHQRAKSGVSILIHKQHEQKIMDF